MLRNIFRNKKKEGEGYLGSPVEEPSMIKPVYATYPLAFYNDMLNFIGMMKTQKFNFNQKTLLYLYASNRKYEVNGKISHLSFSLYFGTFSLEMGISVQELVSVNKYVFITNNVFLVSSILNTSYCCAMFSNQSCSRVSQDVSYPSLNQQLDVFSFQH